MNELLLSYFFVEHHYSDKFIQGDYMLEVFASPFLSLWNQILWRNVQTSVSPGFFARTPSMDSQNLRSCGLIVSKAILIGP